MRPAPTTRAAPRTRTSRGSCSVTSRRPTTSPPASAFLGRTGDAAKVVAAPDPRTLTGNMRQYAADLMLETRMVDELDWTGLATQFPGLSFDTARKVYMGESLGGVVGTILAATEP